MACANKDDGEDTMRCRKQQVRDSVKLPHFSVERRLGRTLYLGRDHKIKNKLKLIKQVKLTGGSDSSCEKCRQLRNWKSLLDHAHCVQIEDVFCLGDELYLVTEYCEGESLQGLIHRARKYNEVLNEIEVMDWVVQILLALKHLHQQKIIHQLLNPSNIFLKNNCIKLGLPKAVKQVLTDEVDIAEVDSAEVDGACAAACTQAELETLSYSSPESLRGDDPTIKSDIWSVGCILFELCASQRLFRSRSSTELCKMISSKKIPSFPTHFSPEMAQLWNSLMEDSDKRPTTEELLSLPFIVDHLEDMQESLQKWQQGQCEQKTEEDAPSFHSPVSSASELDDPDLEDDLSLTEEDTRELFHFESR